MSPIRCTSCFFLFFELLVASCDGQTGPRSTIAPAGIELEQLVDSLRIDPGSIRFVVDKSERAFRVMGRVGTHERELRVFPCVLGENAVGDKFHQGDRRTPEGVFTFRSKRVHNEWHKFIWVDYPNAESWRRYKERKRTGAIPPGKDVGGEIGIHGVPDGMDHWITMGVDWTFGCIALRNADVDAIYPYVRAASTTITIEP